MCACSSAMIRISRRVSRQVEDLDARVRGDTHRYLGALLYSDMAADRFPLSVDRPGHQLVQIVGETGSRGGQYSSTMADRSNDLEAWWKSARRLALVTAEALTCRTYRYSTRLLKGLVRIKADLRLRPGPRINMSRQRAMLIHLGPAKLCVQDHHRSCQQQRGPCFPETTAEATATAIFWPIYFRFQCERWGVITQQRRHSGGPEWRTKGPVAGNGERSGNRAHPGGQADPQGNSPRSGAVERAVAPVHGARAVEKRWNLGQSQG